MSKTVKTFYICTIGEADKGKTVVRADDSPCVRRHIARSPQGARHVCVKRVIGRIMDIDVGKRLYGNVQTEGTVLLSIKQPESKTE